MNLLTGAKTSVLKYLILFTIPQLLNEKRQFFEKRFVPGGDSLITLKKGVLYYIIILYYYIIMLHH